MTFANPQARDLAIRTILGEAGGESPTGWQAVAHVMKNRADSGRWGDPSNGGLTNAIRAPSQFSLWNPGNAAGETAMRYQPTDPLYQRVGAVVDNVFNGAPDITNGATHYYAPAGVQGGAPSWAAQGSNKTQIGNHVFMTLPLTGGNTAGTAQPAPAAPAQPASAAPAATDVGAARTYLASISDHATRPGDTSSLHPEFALRLQGALADANRQGLNLRLMSGYRSPNETGSAYDAAGNSSHSYGIAADIGGLDGANGAKTQAWAQIAAAHGLSNPYGTSNAKEFNHWQLMPYPLERNPQQLQALKDAVASGNIEAVWQAGMPYQQAGMAMASNQPPAQPGAPPQGYYPEAQGHPPTEAHPAAPPSAPASGAPAPSAVATAPSAASYQVAQAMQPLVQATAISPPPPPPPLQPQYPAAAMQAPVETPGIQSPADLPVAGDPQASGADQQVPGRIPTPAGARGFDPFRYRRQQTPAGVV